MQPLRRLFGYAAQYRSDVAVATVYSILNKIFDVLPEILIGVEVDVVVNRKDSFVARLGIAEAALDRGHIVESGTHAQLLAAGRTDAAIWRLQTGEKP